MPTIQFTHKKLISLPVPDKGQVDYWAKDEQGLGLRISPSGLRSFVYLTRVNGKVVRFTLGRFIEPPGADVILPLSKAREETENLKRIIDKGGDPRHIKQEQEQSQAAASKNTFRGVAERFLKEYGEKNLRRKTIEGYKSSLLGADCAPVFDRPIQSITRPNILAVLDRIENRGKTVQTNRTLAALKSMMSWAIQKGVIDTVPTDHITPRVTENPRSRHLYGNPHLGQPSELALVWTAFKTLDIPYWGLARMMLLTGQRENEVATMKWENVLDSENGNARWIVPMEDTKTGETTRKDHLVPLCPMAVAVIKAVPRMPDCPFVFTTGKSHISSFSKMKEKIDAEITRLIKAEPNLYAGQMRERWVLHDLRRSVETGLAEMGVPKEIRDALLNHSPGKIGKVYNQAQYIDQKREALLTWENHLQKVGCEV